MASLFLNVLTIKSMSSFSNLRFLFFPSLYSSPNLLASINMTFSAEAALSKNRTETFVPVFANTLLGIEIQPYTQRLSTIFVRTFLSTPLLAVMNPVGMTIAPLPFVFSELMRCWIKHKMLDKTQVDRH